MNFIFEKILIEADGVKITKKKAIPTDPNVKKILKYQQNLNIQPEDIPDDLTVHWKDIKDAFPQQESYFNTHVFKGKQTLTVRELKDIIFSEIKEDEMWLSKVPYDKLSRGHGQAKLPSSIPQVAIQMNIGPKLIQEINKNSIVKKFFKYVSEALSRNGLHPTHSQNIAWARVYTLPDMWIVEEIQSDVFGTGVDPDDLRPMSSGSKAVVKMSPGEKEELHTFFKTNFLGWEKKILANVINLARKEGVKNIWMFAPEEKTSSTSSKSVLDVIYKVTPRDLGFKRDVLEIAEKRLQGWHRIVANTFLNRV